MKNLNKIRQELVNNNGFTYSLNGLETPKSGYMVSIDRTEKIFNSLPTDQEIKKYLNNSYISKMLSIPTNYFGGWFSDKVYFDVSEHNDNLNNAIIQGITNNQLAIYDIKNEIAINIPQSQKSGTITQQSTHKNQLIQKIKDNKYSISGSTVKINY